MDKYLSPLVSCLECREEKSTKGLFTHLQRKHGTPEEKSKYKSGLTKEEQLNIRLDHFQEMIEENKKYYLSPNSCKSCGDQLDWFSRKQKFCSRNCSASYNNKSRERLVSRNEKISESLMIYHTKRNLEKRNFRENFVGPIYKKSAKKRGNKKKQQIRANDVVGPFCRVYFRVCKFCKKEFTEKTAKQICCSCKIETKRLSVDFRFDFNVYDYPNLFDLRLLEEIGWFSPGGKSGKWNPEGLSRDHRVSVSEAVKNNYDPFYIRHPLNCELMRHSENNRKKTKSSISYSELVRKVDEYERLRRSDSN